jgi:hypothetical protein
LSGSSPLTCLAWQALPVAYATASIALGIMWPHKPHHYVKVGIPSGGPTEYNDTIIYQQNETEQSCLSDRDGQSDITWGGLFQTQSASAIIGPLCLPHTTKVWVN